MDDFSFFGDSVDTPTLMADQLGSDPFGVGELDTSFPALLSPSDPFGIGSLNTTLPTLTPPGAGGLGLMDWLKLAAAGMGIGGSIAGAMGGGGASLPAFSTPQRAMQNQLQQALSANLGITQPMYAQGAGLLSAMAQGQVPPGVSNFVDQLYGPQLQNLGTQAIEQSRRAGFALPQDAFTGGPGGAVLGPGLAQMPGLKAQTLMNLAGALMNPGQQGLAAMTSGLNAFPAGTQQQPGLGQQIGMGLGGVGGVLGALGGLGQQGGMRPLGGLYG